MTQAVPHAAPARVEANGIELVYDTFGEPDAPPMLLIMGLGCQMIDWKDEFCSLLAGKGFRVIRFDNRDVGQSTCFEEGGHPQIGEMIEAMQRGEAVEAPYLLSDLVADTIGLLDALGIEKAHVVGLSMGGMIAQLMAAGHPDRVLTLTSIMSTTGEPGLPVSTPAAWTCLTAPLETELGPDRPRDGARPRDTSLRARHPLGGARSSDGSDPGLGQPPGGAPLGDLSGPRDPR
jgi:pimeloyl-ACP methyl ester carboxylesterase